MSLSKICEAGLPPVSVETMADWTRRCVTLKESPYGSRFVVKETPWLAEPLELFKSNHVREIVLQTCAQGGKTVSMSAAICWALANQPAPTMVAAQTDEAAKRFSRQRLMPMIESCAELRAQMPDDRHEKTAREILFTNSTLLIGGANPSFLRAHSMRFIFCDEVSGWADGALEQARARTTRYWNRRHWIASTPLSRGDDFDNAFSATDQREWQLLCPHCSVHFTPDFFAVIKWDENEITRPAGKWVFDHVRKSVRMKCPKCEADIANTETNSRTMNAGGRYEAQNSSAPSHLCGFRFNALCLSPSMLSWADLVEQFLKAREQEKTGNLSPLKEFQTLRLAMPWDEAAAHAPVPILLSEYDSGADWPMESVRFLTVDCQHDLTDFWCVARAWGKDGESRLLDFRRLRNFAEIEMMRAAHNIKPRLTFLDVGYEFERVIQACSRHGWTGLRGDGATGFAHPTNNRRESIRRIYSPIKRADPRAGRGNAVPYFRWSNPAAKDILHLLRTGQGAKWEAKQVGALTVEYAKQMDSERRMPRLDRAGRIVTRWISFRVDNHAWDCESMQVVCAAMACCLVAEVDTPSKPEDFKDSDKDQAGTAKVYQLDGGATQFEVDATV